MVACSAAPANFAGVAAVALADVTLTPGAGNGDFTIGNATSGRQLTVAAQEGVEVDTTGTANHVALHDGTTLLHVTECTPKALVDGDTVNFPAFSITVSDPTAP